MLNKEHITRGEAVVKHDSSVYICGVEIVRTNYHKANAAFIADCFNVLNESSKTARELYSERDELHNFLHLLKNELKYQNHINEANGLGKNWADEIERLEQLLNK